MQLRSTPTEKECKEEMHRKIKMERKRKFGLKIVSKPS
jgi:hypothetical protein